VTGLIDSSEPADTTSDRSDATVRTRWWHRPRRLSRQLTGVFVGVAAVSVLLIGSLNFVAARDLLDDGTKEQLVDIGRARAYAIELGAESLVTEVSVLASDLAVSFALDDFADAFAAMDDTLDEPTDVALSEFYAQDVIDPLTAGDVATVAGLDKVDPERLEPTDPRVRYLQGVYTLAGVDRVERRAVVDPGDGSAYTEVHARQHPFLRSLSDAVGVGDLLLVDAQGNVVYSVNKRVDVGTSFADGPFATSNLAVALRDGLDRVRVGDAVIADFERYLPAAGRSVAFIAAAVRLETEVIGALVVEIDVDALTRVTTADEQWELVGLGGGESYVVGADLLLRSESRRWIEDPDDYLSRVDDPVTRTLIEGFGSPIGVQQVDTEPAREARDGRDFEGSATNYLGESTFSFATPIDVVGVDWAVVVDVPNSDVASPLSAYARRLGLVLMLTLPIAGAIGWWLSRRMTRPIPPVIAAARAVLDGERDPQIDSSTNDEFADLSRRLAQMARRLGAQEAALVEEYDAKRQLLEAFLPKRVVGADGEVTGSGDVLEDATVVAVEVVVESDDDRDDDLVAAARRIVAVAADHGVELVRGAADRFLFLVGIGSDGPCADAAIGFAQAVVDAVHGDAVHGDAELRARVVVGMASGEVGTGLLQRGSLTFAAWGAPVRQALAISSERNEFGVIVDGSTRDALGDGSRVRLVEGSSPTRWRLAASATA
jgi:hypothetical protein